MAILAKYFAADVAFESFHISMNTGHMFNKVCFSLQYFLADMAAKLAHLLLN
jgi:hypothetical protein